MRRPLLGLRRLALRDAYDAVIIGGGVQGLSLAYNLAKEGYTNVAVLDKAYLASGASGRNATMVRDSFATPEWIKFFHFSKQVWETISDELDCNVMFTPRGVLSVAEFDETLNSFRGAVNTHRKMGIESEVLDRKQVRDVVSGIGDHINGGLLSRGGLARHDALVWGYAVAADRLGVEIHSETEVLEIDVRDNEIAGVRTNRGYIRTRRVVNAAGGLAAKVGRMAGADLPLKSETLEKFVTDSVKPVLNVMLQSSETRCALIQTSRGEIVGGSSETSGDIGLRSTYDYLKASARTVIRIFPAIAGLTVVRQWGGLLSVTPDHAALVGEVEEVKGLFVNVGWGGYGFMAAPGAGKLLAPWFLNGKRSEIIEPFDLGRYKTGKLIPETLIPVGRGV